MPVRLMPRLLCVYLFLVVTFVISEPTELSLCSNASINDCCLCAESHCDNDCPSPLKQHVLFDNNQYSCELIITTTTSSTNHTVTLDTTDHSNSETNTDTEPRSEKETYKRNHPNITVCLHDCPDGFYVSQTNVCEKCDIACTSCNGSGSANCVACKFSYNGACYANCPNDTKVNGTNCIGITDKHEETPEKSSLPAIIGGGVGGGVVVVIVVVIILCCCYRRRHGLKTSLRGGKGTKRKTVMSGILQEKESNTQPKGREMGSGGSRLQYENTAPIDKDLHKTIPRQGDVVLRYTKDPTESVKANTLKRTEPGTANRDSELYENAAMVRMARQMDLRKMTTETINEQLDIEALPMAPKVPAEPSGVQTGPPHPKQKVTMVKRLSQKLIRKKKKRNAVLTEPVDEPGQNYVDMSHSAGADEEGQEPFENQSTEEQEDYENVQVDSKNQSKHGVIAKTQSNTGEKSKKQLKSDKVQPGTEAELEDYENAPEKIKELSKNQSKRDNNQTGSEADLEDYENAPEKIELYKTNKERTEEAGELTNKERTDEAGELENYEYMGETKQENTCEKTDDKKSKSANEDELEDYENLNPEIKKGKVNQMVEMLGAKKNTNNKVKGKVTENAAVEDDLEDYENTKQFAKTRKLKQAKFENPYENTEFIRRLQKQNKT